VEFWKALGSSGKPFTASSTLRKIAMLKSSLQKVKIYPYVINFA